MPALLYVWTIKALNNHRCINASGVPCRPFAWKGGLYLSHWLSLLPSQDKPALAKLDLEHNSLSLVYRFDTLEDELAKLKGHRARTHERSTSTLEQVWPCNWCCLSNGSAGREDGK